MNVKFLTQKAWDIFIAYYNENKVLLTALNMTMLDAQHRHVDEQYVKLPKEEFDQQYEIIEEQE